MLSASTYRTEQRGNPGAARRMNGQAPPVSGWLAENKGLSIFELSSSANGSEELVKHHRIRTEQIPIILKVAGWFLSTQVPSDATCKLPMT